MLTILLGPDDFSKKDHISSLAKKNQAEVEFFVGVDDLPDWKKLLEQDLFAKKKLMVLEGLLASLSLDEEKIDKLAKSLNHIIIVEEKVDKRLAASKVLLSHKKVEVKDFSLPHGSELDIWIAKRVSALGGRIGKSAASQLARRLGRDEAIETKFGGKVVDVKEIYNLWQADSEIRKLLAYAENEEITEDAITELVSENGEVDALEIVNAIGDKNKDKALAAVGEFLREGDDKAGIIQLNALLSEQFRNIAALQDMQTQRLSEDAILDLTKWKSGRVFVLKKIASRFPAAKVRDCLDKLAALDAELKSSSTPPRVLLDLILAQLLV